MEYTKLGGTGLDVSRICLGCMSYGGGIRGNHAWSPFDRFTGSTRPISRRQRPFSMLSNSGASRRPPSAHRGRCPFGALHLILEDWLLPVQSSAATNGSNTDRMGRSDRSRRTHEDIL